MSTSSLGVVYEETFHRPCGVPLHELADIASEHVRSPPRPGPGLLPDRNTIISGNIFGAWRTISHPVNGSRETVVVRFFFFFSQFSTNLRRKQAPLLGQTGIDSFSSFPPSRHHPCLLPAFLATTKHGQQHIRETENGFFLENEKLVVSVLSLQFYDVVIALGFKRFLLPRGAV